MKIEKYTIYSISDPRDGCVFYIGMTQDYYSRTRSHLTPGSTSVTRSRIASIRESELEPIFNIIKEISATRDDAIDIESTLILEHTLNGVKLVNRRIQQRVLISHGISANPLENSYEKGKRPPYHPTAWQRTPKVEKIFTNDQVQILMKKAISGTIDAMQKWLESDKVFVVDTDTGKRIDRNVEIDSAPGSVKEYVMAGLKEKGNRNNSNRLTPLPITGMEDRRK